MAEIRQETAQAKPGAVSFTVEEQTRLEQIKTIVCRFIDEALNQGNESTLNELLDSNFVLYHPQSPEPVRGIEGFKNMLKMFRTAFPDFKLTIADLVIQGDKAAVRVAVEATNTGPWMNKPPSNRRATWSAANFVRISNGKIIENFVDENTITLLRQLGFTSIEGMFGEKY